MPVLNMWKSNMTCLRKKSAPLEVLGARAWNANFEFFAGCISKRYRFWILRVRQFFTKKCLKKKTSHTVSRLLACRVSFRSVGAVFGAVQTRKWRRHLLTYFWVTSHCVTLPYGRSKYILDETPRCTRNFSNPDLNCTTGAERCKKYSVISTMPQEPKDAKNIVLSQLCHRSRKMQKI